MNNIVLDNSEKALRRIKFLEKKIEVYQKNIDSVYYAFSNFIHNKRNCDLQRRIRYTEIPKSESLFRFTLKNLTDQVLMMKNELSVINKYYK